MKPDEEIVVLHGGPLDGQRAKVKKTDHQVFGSDNSIYVRLDNGEWALDGFTTTHYPRRTA